MRPRPISQVWPLALAGLLAYGILTLWITERWALGLYQACALGACAAWGVWIATRPARLHGAAPVALLALVPLWGLLQLAAHRTIYRWETLISVLDWTTNLAIFFLAIQLLANSNRRDRFLAWLLYFGAGISVLSAVQMFTSDGKIFWLFPSGYSDFVLGPFVYKNQYAAFIETVLPLALYYGIKRKNSFPYWAIAGIMVASVIASASRAGTLLVLTEVVMIPILAIARGQLQLRAAALPFCVGIALSAAFTAVVGWDAIWNRFQQADPYGVRREMVLSSVQMVRDRPAMGFGLGTWPTAYPAYALYDDGLFANQAHNDWVQWAVEGGLPLLAAMLIFAFLLARLAWNSLWGFGLISVMLHSLVDYPMQQRPALAGWFFAMAGVLVAAKAGKTLSVVTQKGAASL